MTAVETVCRFHERKLVDDPEQIAELIHEEAEMTLVISHLTPLRGRREIMRAIFRGREGVFYRARVERCEVLDESTLFVRGHARYALPGEGVAESQTWWIDELRDGLLWRVRTFTDEAAARLALTSLVTTEPG